MRILHFSDPHILTSFHNVPWYKWLSKRAIGRTNLLLRRAHFFAHAQKKITALTHFTRDEQIDLVLCTGDYTALGFGHEYREAVRVIKPLMDVPHGYITVPGNHDYYIADVPLEERFSSYFLEALSCDLPEYQADGLWPLVRLIGEKLAVIAINSARPNPLPWRSSGRISDKQLETLTTIAGDTRIKNRLVLIMTHYAPLLADGSPDTRLHGLTNAQEFLNACSQFKQTLVLCGHKHQRYHVKEPETGVSIFCAGSVTMESREGFWLFDIDEERLQATPGHWSATDGKFKLGMAGTAPFQEDATLD